MSTLEQLRFPLGEFDVKTRVTDEQLPTLIGEIANAPAQLREALEPLNDDQLDTPYRPGGWTARQVVHHLADSHMNSIIRIKWALTEDEPMIKPYFEERWAELTDSRTAPVDVSLRLLESLHERWAILLNSLSPGEVGRCFRHPEMGRISLRVAIAFYAWHGRHHIAHIMSVGEREDR